MKNIFIISGLLFCQVVLSQVPDLNKIQKESELYKEEFKKNLSYEFLNYFQDCKNDSMKWNCCLVGNSDEKDLPNAQKKLLCPCNTLNGGIIIYKTDTIVYTHREPTFIDFMDWFVYRKNK